MEKKKRHKGTGLYMKRVMWHRVAQIKPIFE